MTKTKQQMYLEWSRIKCPTTFTSHSTQHAHTTLNSRTSGDACMGGALCTTVGAIPKAISTSSSLSPVRMSHGNGVVTFLLIGLVLHLLLQERHQLGKPRPEPATHLHGAPYHLAQARWR